MPTPDEIIRAKLRSTALEKMLMQGVTGLGDVAKRTYQGILADPAVDAYRMGLGQRASQMVNQPIQFMTSAAQDVVPRPQELLRGLADAAQGNLNPQSAVAKKIMDLGMFGITAFHGSPYKFDKFEMSKIGTGEGAQAYGHGLYFAESPEVARSYQPAALNIKEGRTIAEHERDAWSKGYAAMLNASGDAAAARKSLENQARIWERKSKTPADADAAKWQIPRIRQAIDFLDSGAYQAERSSSSMYRVDIPDEQVAKMLDWDKPLSQQPQAVKDVANKLYAPQLKTRPVGPDLVDVHLYGGGGGSLGVFPTAKVKDILANPADYLPFTGGSFYESTKLVPGPTRDKVAASEILRSLGIPGIRYLDQGSRAGGSGTSNFVVFDENLPKILSRE